MKRTEWRQETKQMRFEDAYAGYTAVMPDPDPASRKKEKAKTLDPRLKMSGMTEGATCRNDNWGRGAEGGAGMMIQGSQLSCRTPIRHPEKKKKQKDWIPD